MSTQHTSLSETAGVDRSARAREYFTALVRHETDLWNSVEKGMRGEGVLSLARLEVLRIVHAAPTGARVQDVATGVGTSIAAASRLLDRLAADGLIRREPDPGDRRSVRSTLSAQGRDAVAVAQERFEAALDTVLAAVDVEAMATVTAALGRLQAALEGAR